MTVSGQGQELRSIQTISHGLDTKPTLMPYRESSDNGRPCGQHGVLVGALNPIALKFNTCAFEICGMHLKEVVGENTVSTLPRSSTSMCI